MSKKLPENQAQQSFGEILRAAQDRLGFKNRAQFSAWLGQNPVNMLRWCRDDVDPRYSEAIEILRKIGFDFRRAEPGYDIVGATLQHIEVQSGLAEQATSYGSKKSNKTSPVLGSFNASGDLVPEAPAVPDPVSRMLLGYKATGRNVELAHVSAAGLEPQIPVGSWLLMASPPAKIPTGTLIALVQKDSTKLCRLVSVSKRETLAQELADLTQLHELDRNVEISHQVLAVVAAF